MVVSTYSKKKEVVTHISLDGLPVERRKLRSNTAPHIRRISKQYTLVRFCMSFTFFQPATMRIYEAPPDK